MFGSWELVERSDMPTAMQMEREGPWSQNIQPIAAHPKSGAAAQADRMHEQTEKTEVLVLVITAAFQLTALNLSKARLNIVI